jgi:integrase
MAPNAADGFRRTDTNRTTHSKDDALDDREFELLFEGASRLDEYYGIQAQFLVQVLGRLGLRRGELAHMTQEWIDWRKEMIRIPRQQDCHGGRDGGVCGYCRQLAEQRVDYREDLPLDASVAMQWVAKTDAAARDVYFGFDPRVRLWIERFFDRFDEWVWSPAAINRRVKRAAEHADGLDPDEVRPHSLRASAATHHAARGLEMHALMQYFGWAQPSTAKCYLARNGQNTARQLDAIHSG